MDKIQPTPRCGLIGGGADALLGAKRFANRARIPDGVPLIGGQGLGDLLLGHAPEEVDNWSYGDLPMTIDPGVTGSRVPRFKTGRSDGFSDVLTALPVGALLGKGGGAALHGAVPSSGGPASLAHQLGAITPEGQEKLLRALRERHTERVFKVGELEPQAVEALTDARSKMGWRPTPSHDVLVAPRDIRHMLKRVDENGMSPEDLVRMAESVLAPDAAASVSPMGGRINLTGSALLDLPPGGRAQAIGRITSRKESPGPSLYGLMPGEGWNWKK